MREIPCLKITNAAMDALPDVEGKATHVSEDGRLWPLPPLYVDSSMSELGKDGDIIMLTDGAGGPARDWRTGIPVPPNQKFVLRFR